MRIEFIKLAEHIIDASNGGSVYLLSYSGNWGDALIRFGTLCFLRHFGISYKEINLDSSITSRIARATAGLSGKVLLAMGGGAWAEHFTHYPSSIRNIARKYNFSKIIILPTTYSGNFEPIESAIYFRRDKYESAKNMPESIFCHDLAFFINNVNCAPTKQKETAYCFRTDIESSNTYPIPKKNYDLSVHGNEKSNIGGFFEYLANYSEVHTDRLHVAIGSCLLKKAVYLYPGSYFKNKAIFKSSIEGYFENAYFSENFNGAPED